MAGWAAYNLHPRMWIRAIAQWERKLLTLRRSMLMAYLI
jgi:hypothetical protein